MYMVRYADDFVCLFQYENEAQRFYQLLIERLRKFGLEIAEDKSRILPFGRYKGTKESFDFLGFTHYNATSHWGKYCVLHRTSRKKLKMKREAVKKWLWEHMHESIADTIEALNVKLTGHYRYYGIYGNYIGRIMRAKEELPECPVATAVSLIGGKWKLLILRNLKERPWRFNELQRSIDGISQKVLTDSLRQMMSDGLAYRHDYHEQPPRVEYGLTELGTKMLPIVNSLADFGNYYKSIIEQN